MTAVLLLLAAAAVLYADQIKAFLEKHRGTLNKVTPRHWAAAALIAAGLVVYLEPWSRATDDGRPTPAPGTVGDLDLTGLFTGPEAAEDAVALAGLCDALAQYVQDDGGLAKPRLTTGWQVADLRSAARDIRLEGETFGSRQPAVRDAVKAYLDRPEILGKDGGPLGPKDRAKWITAFRDIARAAEAAVR